MALTQFDYSQLSQNTFVGLGRNRIINGDMNIDQANAATDVTVNSGTVKYATDQFWGVGTAASGVFLLAQDATGPTGFQNSLRATCSTADASIGATDVYAIQSVIEGYNVRDLQFGSATAKTITLSFWVKASLTGIYTGALANNGSTRCFTFEYTVSVANTWEYKTITIVGETTGTWNVTTGNGLYITWALAVGSTFQAAAGSWGTSQVFGTANQVNFMSSNTTRTWAMTGVQLEIGSSATPFEYRPYPMELALCQRYYEKSYEVAVKPGTNTTTGSGRYAGMNTQGTTYIYNSIMYKVTKRTAPTVTTFTPSGTSGSITVTSNANVDSNQTSILITNSSMEFSVAQNTAGVVAELSKIQWTADARL